MKQIPWGRGEGFTVVHTGTVELHSDWQPLICFWSPWICPWWVFYINRIPQYVAFCIWLFSHSVFKAYSHRSRCQCIIPFYGCIILQVRVGHIWFMHPSVGAFGGFHSSYHLLRIVLL